VRKSALSGVQRTPISSVRGVDRVGGRWGSPGPQSVREVFNFACPKPHDDCMTHPNPRDLISRTVPLALSIYVPLNVSPSSLCLCLCHHIAYSLSIYIYIPLFLSHYISPLPNLAPCGALAGQSGPTPASLRSSTTSSCSRTACSRTNFRWTLCLTALRSPTSP